MTRLTRRHIAFIAFLLALAAIVGGGAVLRTAQLGAAARPLVSDAQITARSRRLDWLEAQLRRQAKQKPPALGALPARPQRVTYVRPAPIVRVLHRSHGDDGGEGSLELDD
jgi:hypothetical protein